MWEQFNCSHIFLGHACKVSEGGSVTCFFVNPAFMQSR
jgi:hypothetical protein